jgi:hypothetical protein
MSVFRSVLSFGALLFLAACGPGAGAIPVTLKDHKFTPSEIRVPADRPVLLSVSNEDATAEEFDSSSLKVEKVIAGHDRGNVRIRPLARGRYPFMGEYHSQTAQGVVIAE